MRAKIFIKKYYFLLCNNLPESFPLKSFFINKLHKLYRFESAYSNENLAKIKSLKNIHKGKRAFIIGMGPSLKVSDLDLLGDEITFACNKIYLSYDETSWRPTYYAVSDTLVALNNTKAINDLDIKHKFYRNSLFKHLATDKRVIWLNDLEFWGKKKLSKFWRHIETGVFRGGTVLFMQMQIAAYMGITEIYIIGADYHFDEPKFTSGKTSDVGKVLINDTQQNHFHPDYRAKGETWAKPNLKLQKRAFRFAREYGEKHGIKIYNASRRTKLETFERVDFDSLFN